MHSTGLPRDKEDPGYLQSMLFFPSEWETKFHNNLK
jgi:hypothetical protein